jgi:hypothetical protein
MVKASRLDHCSKCGKEVERSWSPAEVIVCLVCRRKSPAYLERTASPPKDWGQGICPICSTVFARTSHNQVYCSAICRESRRNWSYGTKAATAEERGYGKAHREERARWKPIVDNGQAVCCLCGQWIEPGTEWHLDHTEDRTGYRGASHASCNRRDGATRGARRTNARRRIEKQCATCQRVFVTPYPKQTYCSAECRPKPERRPVVSVVRYVRCQTCGQLFTAKRAAKFCPAHRGYQERSSARACATCGVEMECKQGRKTYCSKRCRPSSISGAQQRKRRRLLEGGGVASIPAA